MLDLQNTYIPKMMDGQPKKKKARAYEVVDDKQNRKETSSPERLNTMEKIMRMEKAIMTNYKSYNFNCYVEQGFDAYVSLCSDVMHVISYRSIYGFAYSSFV